MPKPLGRHTLSGGIAHLGVGPDDVPFDVHLELLCDQSPYFDRLLTSRYENDVNEPISFPDEDPDVFAQFINWLYRGDLAPSDVAGRSGGRSLCQLWVLAQKFEMPELQDLAISRLQKIIEHKPKSVLALDTVEYVYAHTDLSSPLRLMMVDVWQRNATTMNFQEGQEALPHPFLHDLCSALIEEKRPNGSSDMPDRQDFVHPTKLLKGKNCQPIERRYEPGEIPQPATPVQMHNRNIKTPKSHMPKVSPASSVGIATPPSTTTDEDVQERIARDVERLRIRKNDL